MKKPVKILSKVEIVINSDKKITLIDEETGVILNPIEIIINNDKKTIKYYGLWLHNFSIFFSGTNKKIIIDTSKKSEIKINNTDIKITHFVNVSLMPKIIAHVIFPIYNLLFKFGWNYTFKISNMISVCKYLDDEIFKNLGRRGTVIPIPINEKDFPDNVRDLKLNHPSILLIQNHQIKLKSEALVTFKETIKQLPDVTFYISKGHPENRNNKYYKNVIESLEPLKNVKFVDINLNNKYDYLNSTDIYVLRTGLDCTPATILEAGLAKKPIIASNIGGIPDMIKDGVTGWSINNKSNKWIQTINLLISDRKMLKKMGIESYNYALKYYEIKIIAKKLFNEITS